MKQRAFLEEISKILTPALELFIKQSPQRQQKYLAWIDKTIADEKDEFKKDISLRVRKLFADEAHKTEVAK